MELEQETEKCIAQYRNPLANWESEAPQAVTQFPIPYKCDTIAPTPLIDAIRKPAAGASDVMPGGMRLI